MSGKKLLSVAEIARQIDTPESTVHYWKNRFAQYLPSAGKKRQKRFRPEAVDVFKTIATMLSEGYSTAEVTEHLSRSVPLNATVDAGIPDVSVSHPVQSVPVDLPVVFQETAVQMARSIGQEMARGLADALKMQSAPAVSADIENRLQALSGNVAEHCAEVEGQVEALIEENADLKIKLEILEAELVRLRKDRREQERFLLDKIRSVTK